MIPPPTFRHLLHLTDSGGLYEHALLTQPRTEHGYCVDDVARALVVVSRETESPPALDGLRAQYLGFLLAAQADDGRFHNRRDAALAWVDEPSTEDCWGRALWGLGAHVALSYSTDGAALAAFDRGARHRSPWPRAMAFAALGAADVLTVVDDHPSALSLLADAAALLGEPMADTGWMWPERRLTYANAVVPEVLLAAGTVFGTPRVVADGLRLLGWLLDLQTRDGHLSVVPVGGQGPQDTEPGFDQQPIEVAALADACARAYDLTGDARWRAGVELAAAWFLGSNDSGTSLYDPDSGGGCDGLEQLGRNENQGAESTLALVSTLQHARRLLAPSVR